MRPPECAVCGVEFDPREGRLVTFAERGGDRQWRESTSATGAVGHPPNVDWFCKMHADAASALSTDTIDVALASLSRTMTAELPDVVRVDIAPRHIDDIRALFHERVSTLVGTLNAAPSTTTERTWSPMDGSVPPDCPFDDVDITTVKGDRGVAELLWDRAMWNPDDAARRTVTLAFEPLGAQRCSVSATVGAGFEGSEGSAATQLIVVGALDPQLQGLVDELKAAT